MNTNGLLIAFILENFLLILVVIILLAPIIPPEWSGYWKHKNNDSKMPRASRISLLRMVFNSLINSIFTELLINGLAAFSFNQAITLIIFVVVGFDIFSRHQISQEAITLTAIGIIALYLEKLITSGSEIKLFWGLLQWSRNDDSSMTVNKK